MGKYYGCTSGSWSESVGSNPAPVLYLLLIIIKNLILFTLKIIINISRTYYKLKTFCRCVI